MHCYRFVHGNCKKFFKDPYNVLDFIVVVVDVTLAVATEILLGVIESVYSGVRGVPCTLCMRARMCV